MSRAAYAALAFLIWLVAAVLFLDAQEDMVRLRLMERNTTTYTTKGE